MELLGAILDTNGIEGNAMRKFAGPTFLALLCVALLCRLWPKQLATIPVSAAPVHSSAPSLSSAAARGSQSSFPVANVGQLAARLQERINGASDLLEFSNVAIRFWGLVVDQDGKPIDGVKIVGHVMRGYMAAPGYISESPDEFEALSRDDGRFAITGLQGSLMEITKISKDGYKPFPTNRWSFTFYDSSPSSIFKADSNAPVIFRMWKNAGAERLIYGDRFYKIVPDGRIYGIDLLNGQTMNDGARDLLVEIKRPHTVNTSIRYTWSFKIECVRGGVVEAADDFMYLAPEDGYQPAYTFVLEQAHPEWSDRVSKRFFVKSRDGQVYSRMEVEVISKYQDNAVFSVKSFANPAGSRNLEYDPAQTIKSR